MELDVFDPRVATSERIKAILGDFLEEIPTKGSEDAARQEP